MDNPFFERPILNSPCEYPSRHWKLDEAGQPTRKIVGARRPAEFITPIPKPRRRKGSAEQASLRFDEGRGLSNEAQAYDHTAIINGVREAVDRWRRLPDPSHWRVTPTTARLLRHWRHHRFGRIRPFFCQVEAVETAIWLSEVAPGRATPGGASSRTSNARATRPTPASRASPSSSRPAPARPLGHADGGAEPDPGSL